jgi:hypothetical protein
MNKMNAYRLLVAAAVITVAPQFAHATSKPLAKPPVVSCSDPALRNTAACKAPTSAAAPKAILAAPKTVAAPNPSVNCNDPSLKGAVICTNKNAVLTPGVWIPGTVKNPAQAVVIPNANVAAPKCYVQTGLINGVPHVQTVCSQVR